MMKTKAMEINTSTGLTGLLVTTILWAASGIFKLMGAITLANIASIAAIGSAVFVMVANLPKVIKVVKELFKNKNKQP